MAKDVLNLTKYNRTNSRLWIHFKEISTKTHSIKTSENWRQEKVLKAEKKKKPTNIPWKGKPIQVTVHLSLETTEKVSSGWPSSWASAFGSGCGPWVVG